MNAQPEGISETLAALDAIEAQWAHAAARRLAAIGIQTRIHATDARSEGWYVGDNFAFRPASHKSAPIGASADALACVLDDHDELLAEIESATGYATEFFDYGALSAGAAVIELFRKGEQLGEMVIRVALHDSTPSEPLGIVALEGIAARLELPDTEALGPGDLILLSQGPWRLASAPHCCGVTELAFDPASGRLGPAFPDPVTSQDMPLMTQPANPQALTIPVTVRLADLALSADEIAELTSSGTVDLGPVSEGLCVTVSVGGRAIGGGEIVRLGDRFGVLLDSAQEWSDQRASGEEVEQAGDDDRPAPSSDEAGQTTSSSPMEAS